MPAPVRLSMSAIALFGLASAFGAPARQVPVGPNDKTPLKNGGLENELKLGDRARKISDPFAGVPLRFEENQGQFASHVKFVSRGPGFDLTLTDSGPVFVLYRQKGSKREDGLEQTALRMEVRGGARQSNWTGEELLPGVSNYFLGSDATRWRRNVPGYARVKTHNVLPGVDMVFYSRERKLEYDLQVAPGVDPSTIEIAWDGARSLRVDKAGNLILDTMFGELVQPAPLVYQDVNGKRKVVEARYSVRENGGAAFEIAAYDRAKPLTIDPIVMTYSTYLGSVSTTGYDIAVDKGGSAYILGQTNASTFPLVNPYQTANVGLDMFVTKFNRKGDALVYSTFIGGNGNDFPRSIALDVAGYAYVLGTSTSTDYPRVGALDSTLGDGSTALSDLVVTKLNQGGNALVYSTYFGGTQAEQAAGIAVDSSNSAYIGGFFDGSLPTAYGTPNQLRTGSRQFFIAKFAAAGNSLSWLTYLGNVLGNDIAVDGAGVYFGGQNKAVYPAVSAPSGLNQTRIDDGFVGKLNPAGTALLYYSLIGGANGLDQVNRIAVDDTGALYAGGLTQASDFPLVNPYRNYVAPTGGTQFQDAFLAKFSPAGSTLVYSTYFGGTGQDLAQDVVVDKVGRATIVGTTGSTNLPLLEAYQSDQTGDDVFATQFTAAGNALVYSTYIGSGAQDIGQGAAGDASGALYVTGITSGSGYPMVNPYQSTNPGGGFAAFLSKIKGDVISSAVVRSSNGGLSSIVYPENTSYFFGGVFASDPSAAQDATGQLYVTARDTFDGIYIGSFDTRARTWGTFRFLGGITVGRPAIVTTRPSGGTTVYVAIRDKFDSYWLLVYDPVSGGFSWNHLQGVFATDPAIAAAPNGAVYIVGQDKFSGIWTSRWVPGSGFQGWRFMGGITKGQPSIGVDDESSAYIAVRDTFNSGWMLRVQSDTMLGWNNGGGILAKDPQVVFTGGDVRMVAQDSGGSIYLRTFALGSLGGWGTWNQTGVLDEVTASGLAGDVFLAGRDSNGDHWWHEASTATWTNIGQRGISEGLLSAGPR